MRRAQGLMDAIERSLPRIDDDPDATLVALAEIATRVQRRIHASKKETGEPS